LVGDVPLNENFVRKVNHLLARQQHHAVWTLYQRPFTNVTLVILCIAKLRITTDNEMLSYRRETALQGAL